MPAVYSLSDLIPEPLSFKDDRFGGDGTIYDVNTADMLGAADYAAFKRLEGLFSSAMKRFQDAEESGKQADMDRAGKELDQAVTTMLRILIPTLPDERMARLPFGTKYRVIEWWSAEREKAIPKGEAQAGQA